MSKLTSIRHELTSAAWWRAATMRAGRTVLAAAIPFFVAVSIFDIDWVLAGSTVALSAIVSYATSLGGLKEVAGDNVNKLLALAVRATKTFAQVLVSFVGAAVVLTEVDWSAALAFAASATVVSLFNGLISQLPETDVVLTES